MTQNRRQFSRIQFHTDAKLYFPSGEVSVVVEDISLKGALITLGEDVFIPVGSSSTLKVELGDQDILIRMEATLVHRENLHCGLACREIDLDSITHLRRLVELNLGNEDLLQRELSVLTA